MTAAVALWTGRVLERTYIRDAYGRFAEVPGGSDTLEGLLDSLAITTALGGVFFDDDRRFDWSSRGKDGSWRWEIKDPDGDDAFPELSHEEMRLLHGELTDTLNWRRRMAGTKPDNNLILDDAADGSDRYFDWSDVRDEGTEDAVYHLTVEDGEGNIVAMDLTENELERFHREMTLSLIADLVKVSVS